MQTKFTTGQTILIPAVIRAAREENGKIIYEVNADYWDGIPEENVVIDNEALSRAAYDRALAEMSRSFY